MTPDKTPDSPDWNYTHETKHERTGPASGTATVAPGAPDVLDLTAYPAPLLRLVPDLEPEEATTGPKVIHPLLGFGALAAIIAYCVAYGHLRTLAVVGALAFMIFFHELGHFLAAKVTGMKATEFFLGFGPRLWSFRRGETEFGIKALPLGGYVKVIGMTNLEEVDPVDEARTYRQATYPRRVLLASAGTLAHMLLAFLLLIGLYAGLGTRQQLIDMKVEAIRTLDSGRSPAKGAGIAPGDEIVGLNGKTVTIEQLAEAVQANTGSTMQLTIRRNGTERVVPVIPELQKNGTRLIGVTWHTSVSSSKLGVGESVTKAGSTIGHLIPETWGGLFKFFAPSNLKAYGKTLSKVATNKPLTQAESEGRMSSPVGITRLMSDASKNDVRVAIELFAIINVFVGMFNMLPLLPLDGGHVLVATYERLRSLRGRRHMVDFRKLMPVTYLVLTVMGLVGFSALYLDIANPLHMF